MERTIEIASPDEAMMVCGLGDRNLKLIRDALPVNVHARNGTIRLVGDAGPVKDAAGILEDLATRCREDEPIPSDHVEKQLLRLSNTSHAPGGGFAADGSLRVEMPSVDQLVRSPGQERYLRAILANDVVFCVGPAGTGKTFLAVQMAIGYLRGGDVRKIILCRPAVEAGEKLGFLPGDFHAKVNPYLRPIYDALNEILDYEKVKRYLEREIIEVIPLAYMRGRTLNNAFIILDEGQNTTVSQMKMFLTRMGLSSKIVVNGDVTQVDLPSGSPSGLNHARRIMRGCKGIARVELEKRDIVRHALVRKMISLYEKDDKARSGSERTGPHDKRTAG